MKRWSIIVLLAIIGFSLTVFLNHAESHDDYKKKMYLMSPYASEVDVYELTYPSDGLQIKGFLLQPKNIQHKQLPLLVYNRGGNRDHGAINKKTLHYLSSWAAKGYVVIASQYRGNGGSEGTETYGGDDIHDVMNLIQWAEELPYVNQDKKVAIGYSRGGMMTYLLMKNNIEFDAVAVVSGITDMFQFYEQRGTEMKEVLKQLVGDPNDDYEKYRSRSVIYWSEKINSPLLLLHGDHDKKVHHTQAEKLVKHLEKNEKEHRYILYKGADHPIRAYFTQYNAEIDQWFNQHLNNNIEKTDHPS
ncbi:alpha/beta hydrolase family protein [Metabacillus iocasae]|uniref:Dipeptidyl aminopeptidase/acylaminoacyl peptidase n=1 Tax=Priestia iocasae TaxID=2291674 RepID=A0ABS2QZ30_9BACI|nr:prolyl oligopeptidase family serine peptidase [Metabacillus iocasae]MBM7704741.1 dipeptidyl aminopeptidase/acylaminoacyl peptidase [Metabacillus iocasae]